MRLFAILVLERQNTLRNFARKIGKRGVVVLVVAAAMAAVPCARAQGVGTPMGTGVPGSPVATRDGGTVHVKILGEDKKPLKQQALIRLTSQESGRILFQTTNNSETSFADLPPAKYLIEVGAAGYLGVHEEISLADLTHDLSETVILSRDPLAVDLRLKDAQQLPSKARKDAEKGVQALELSNFLEARKHLEAANRRYPSSSSVNFLLGYLALQQKDQDRELQYLTAATNLDPKNVQAQNLLGQLYYGRGDYAHAAAAEEIVVASNGESLIARRVLANSCLKLKNYEEARENSQWIVDKGGRDAVSARLVLGQALAGLQKNQAAIETLTAYLGEDPASPVAPQIRELIARLKSEASGGVSAEANMGIGNPELAEENDSLAGSLGMPADVDAQKLSLAPGIPCPANILEATSIPSKQLVDSVAQFSAIEHMVHENLSAQGTPTNRETRQYNYVVAINEQAEGGLTVQEYRDSGDLDMPDKITTTGLAVLAIAFHPLFREGFEMRCEGLGDWNGQPAWLVHFRQFEDKPSRLRTYVVNGNYYPVRLKGRAWVRADNLQIVHLETDLVRAIPEIHLFTEHTSVSYGPVEFKRSGTDLWLPKSAELYVHFGKRRFYRSESFDHFMLFATEAVDKPKVSKLPTSDAPAVSPDKGSALR